MKKLVIVGIPLLVLSLIIGSLGCAEEEEVEEVEARFTASSTSGSPPLEVQFTDQSKGEISDWEWDFDNDGTVDSTAQNPSHTYDTIGEYTVSLEVSGPDGTDTETKVNYIEVAYETEFTLRLTHITPPESPLGQIAQEFADLVNEETDGRVEVEVYPNGILYSAGTQWEATVTGAVDLVLMSSYFALGELSYLSILYLLGMYEDYEHVDLITRSPELNARVAADLEAKGIHHLGMPNYTFLSAYFNSVKEITVRKDMAGLRFGLRTGSPTLHTDDYAEVVTVEVAPAELLTSLSTGVIDIYTANPSVAVSQMVWEYGAEHAWIGAGGCMNMMLAMNLESWNDLPADIQGIITNEVMPEIMDLSYQIMVDEEDSAIETLSQQLQSVNFETEDDRVAMWEWAQDHPVVMGMKAQAGPEIVQLIEDLRPSLD